MISEFTLRDGVYSSAAFTKHSVCMQLSLLVGDLEDVRRKMENSEVVKLS